MQQRFKPIKCVSAERKNLTKLDTHKQEDILRIHNRLHQILTIGRSTTETLITLQPYVQSDQVELVCIFFWYANVNIVLKYYSEKPTNFC